MTEEWFNASGHSSKEIVKYLRDLEYSMFIDDPGKGLIKYHDKIAQNYFQFNLLAQPNNAR